MDWLKEVWAKLWDPVATPAAVGITAVGGYLLRRFRERMTTLRWSVTHQSVASTTLDLFGKVEILHNGNPVRNLSMCYIEIENESSKDLTNVDFTVSYADETVFLMSLASLKGGKGLQLTDSWTKPMNEWTTLPEADKAAKVALYSFLSHMREYRIPVLNRRAGVTFAALVEVPAGITPAAVVNCEHPGVRLRHRPASPLFLGVNQQRATFLGFMIGVAAVFLVPWSGDSTSTLLSFLMGAMVMLIGAGIIHLARLIGRILG